MLITIRLTPCRLVRGVAALEGFLRARSRSLFAAMHLSARGLGAAAALVLFATTTGDLPAALLKPAPDPRVGRLERFFHLYSCPQPQHVSEYIRAADGYGLDYRLLPAISVRETLCGVGAVQNNRWGYHPGGKGFQSVEAGIDFISRDLAEGFYYKGKTLHQKLFTYNPLSAYPGEVQWIMLQIEPQKATGD